MNTLTLSDLLRPDVAHIGTDLVLTHTIRLWDAFRQPLQLRSYAIFVCRGGRLTLHINDKRYEVEGDTLAVNFPENTLWVESHQDVEAYAVLMSPELFESLGIDLSQLARVYAHFKSHVVYPLPHADVLELYHYFSLLCYNADRPSAGRDDIVRGLLRCGINQLFAIISAQGAIALNHLDVPPSRSAELFTQFLALLSAHCRSERTVQFYADKLCLTPRHLSSVIKGYSGRTISEWVREYVVMEAKRMLAGSYESIQEVTTQLGFPTQSAFGKYFKQATGMSPKEFRKLKIKN